MLADNLRMVLAMVEALAKVPVAHLINIGSDAIYADGPLPLTEASPAAPGSLHGAMHLARELAFRAEVKAPQAHLRPTLIYGAADPHNGYGPNRFRRLAAEGKDIVLFGEGEERRDHVYIDDVAEIVARVLKHASVGALNIATGEVHSFRDIAEQAAAISGKRSAIKGSPRSGPMPHGGYRPFDIAACRKAFPDFEYTALVARACENRQGFPEPQGAAMTKSVLGIVGGSGLYDIPALKNVHWEDVQSPWGKPSDQILFAELDGLPIRFLPRHGRGHKVPPSGINFRANIDALKRAGVTDLVSVSACGSLKEEYPPGHFVLVDQFIDRTFAREKSFFGAGLRGARVDGRSRQPGARRPDRDGGQGGEHRLHARRHLSGHGGPAVLDARREQPLPQLGLRRDRHDQHARGQARPRGRDLLRDRRHGDRLRLLARRARRGRCRRHHQGAARERRQGACPDRAAGPRPSRASTRPAPIGSDRALDVAIITPPEARDPALLAKLDAVAGRVLKLSSRPERR